jgi:Zn-dependent peptidase ImmA (M78 family)/transcriptional regulator with XRE-family HTH domain
MGRPNDAAVGTNLRNARLRSGFSQAQVAAALDIPRSAVSLIESGERSLASTELARVAQVFGWEIEELLFGPTPSTGDDDRPTEDSGAVLQYFRAARGVDPADEAWLVEAQDRWRRYAAVESKVFGAQRWELPVYPVPAGRPYEQGERLAAQERRRLGLSQAPVRSMVDLLEGEGIKVLMLAFPAASQTSGGYFFSDDLGPCVVINENELPSRRRFTEAHEYCHFLVDREDIEGEICTHDRRREHFEMRANAFAAAFLMPAEGIAEALAEDRVDRGQLGPEDIIHLMYRFGVSFQAILWRLLNLRWISPPQRDRLAQASPTALAQRLGYPHEPGEVEPRPDRERRLALEAWRAGHLSAKEVAELVGLAPRDVTRMFGGREAAPQASRRRPLEEPDWL